MAKHQYYAVRKGRVPGIYTTWDDAKAQVHGFAGAEYKGFSSPDAAAAYISSDECISQQTTQPAYSCDGAFAFVDGSFNASTNITGYGGILCGPVREDGTREETVLQGNTADIGYARHRNVGGEMLGALSAVYTAIEKGYPSLTVFYDYEGIRAWAVGYWKTNYAATKLYSEQMRDFATRIELTFKHVKAHTGVAGNERADRLAKEAVGLV